MGELLLLLRGIPEANAKAHRGVWNETGCGLCEARVKSWVSLVTATLVPNWVSSAESPGMHVYFYDIESSLPLGNATRFNIFRPAEQHERRG